MGACAYDGSRTDAYDCDNQDRVYTDEYLRYIDDLAGDERGRRVAWRRMGEGTAFYHGLPCAFSYVPRFFGPASRSRFENVGRITYGILRKVIEHYRSDAVYRKEFRFDPRVEELVLLPSGCPEPLPVARVDFVLDEDTGELHFVEFNTDSSSGMDESRNALAAIAETEPFRRFCAAHIVEDDVTLQFEGWVRSFLQLYRESISAGDDELDNRRPQVAIVACLDSPEPEIGELETYRKVFEREGASCSVFDVRQLSFDGERLIGGSALSGPGNVPIDCVWRFCIVVDLLEHWEEVQALIEAVRSRKVEMIGSFATQIVHDKQLFAVLRSPATQSFLTDEERAFVERHVPVTRFLDDPVLDVEDVIANPRKWVVKPTDWYASKNVIAGSDCDAHEWEKAVRERISQKTHQGISPYIVQEFHPPYRTPAISLYGAEDDFSSSPKLFGNVLGIHLHAGRFGGMYVRQGPYNVVGSAREGLVSPVLWVG